MEYNLCAMKKKDWDMNSEKNGFIKFSSGPKINERLKVSKKRNVFPTNGNDSSHVTPKTSNTPLASSNYVTHDSANVKSAQSSEQKDPIESQMTNSISSITDANILKSVRTYAKKKESISPILCDKSDSDTEKPPKYNYSKKNSLKRTRRDQINPSEPLNGIIENAECCDGFINNLNNSTSNGFTEDINFGIYTDDRIFSLYDSPLELEPSNSSANYHEATFTNEVASNGYLRTRKNLKNHLVEQKRLDSDDDTMEVMRPSPSRTFSKEDTRVSRGTHSRILESPMVVIERMPKNSSPIKMETGLSNIKKPLSMMDLVQRLSVHRKKEVSETSPSPKMGRFATPSPLENNTYADALDTPSPVSKKRRPDTPSLIAKKHRPDTPLSEMVSAVVDTPSPVAKTHQPDTPLSKMVSAVVDTPSPVAKKHRPDTPLLKIANNKRSLSYGRSLDIVERPQAYPKCDSSVSDVDRECSLARNNERSLGPSQNSVVKDTTLKNCTNSKLSTVPIENISKHDPFLFLQKQSNSRSKNKIVCDCGNSNSTNNNNNLMPALTAHVTNFVSTVANIVKQNPDNLQSLSSSHIKAFCESVQRLFLQNNAESSCELFDVHPSKATNALDSNTKDDQCQAFIDNAFNLHKECTYKIITSFIHNFNVCEQFTVKHFCSNPNVVRFMSEFFSRCDKFSLVSVREMNFLFKFPKNDASPFCIVVKDYTRYFVEKIWPLGSKEIESQLIMEYAYKNMSNVEILIMSFFFLKNELLTLKAFVSRFMYIAVLSIYKYYSMMNE